MRDYYALRSLDEIYQAVWRTAVRNDRPVEAVVVVPDPHWLTALYRTVMPEYAIGSAFREKAGKVTYAMPGGAEAVFEWQWEDDPELYGCGVCACPAGTELSKADVAAALGYGGDDPATTRKPKSAWEKNRDSIRALLGGVFGEAGPRLLRRL